MPEADRPLVLERFFPYRVAVLAADVSKELSAVYRDRFGIRPAEWRVLAHLAAAGTGSVREIHRHANLDKAKVSRAVDRLAALGHVSKRPDTHDRRLVALRLTRKGRSVYERIVPHARAFEASLLGTLTKTERAVLDRAIDKLHAALDG